MLQQIIFVYNGGVTQFFPRQTIRRILIYLFILEESLSGKYSTTYNNIKLTNLHLFYYKPLPSLAHYLNVKILQTKTCILIGMAGNFSITRELVLYLEIFKNF